MAVNIIHHNKTFSEAYSTWHHHRVRRASSALRRNFSVRQRRQLAELSTCERARRLHFRERRNFPNRIQIKITPTACMRLSAATRFNRNANGCLCVGAYSCAYSFSLPRRVRHAKRRMQSELTRCESERATECRRYFCVRHARFAWTLRVLLLIL